MLLDLHQTLHQTRKIHPGSSASVVVCAEVQPPLTCYDEQRRTLVNEPSAFAKVRVAGSNPVVRSRNCTNDLRFPSDSD